MDNNKRTLDAGFSGRLSGKEVRDLVGSGATEIGGLPVSRLRGAKSTVVVGGDVVIVRRNVGGYLGNDIYL